MNNTFEKRLMAFMNCPWKSTAGCNLICVDCFRSDPDGLRSLIDDFNRLGRQIEKKEDDDGEYIERSKIAEMLNAVYESGWAIKYSVEMYLNAAQKTLMFLPGADVEEVKHGHWICHGDAGVTECSVCHNDVSEYVEYPRCMFCGAKMDEEDENENHS